MHSSEINRGKRIQCKNIYKGEIMIMVGEETAYLSAIVYRLIMWFLFGEVSSSSGCLGWAASFICGTP